MFVSFKARVINDPVPNFSISCAENCNILSYSALRISLPSFAESRAQRKLPTSVPTPAAKATPSMSKPVRTINP